MDDRSMRKAAILINALDTRTADALLEQMGEEKAAAVRRAVMELTDIDLDEQEQVIQAFLASQDPARRKELSNPQSNAQQTAIGAPQRFALSQQADSRRRSQPFEFLHQADPRSVHAVLHSEHPQTVALVLAHLPPQQAAEVVRLLEKSQQTEILSRVARMGSMDIEILRDVEEEMAVVFSTRVNASQSPAGLSSLQAILAASQERQRHDWLHDIETADPEIAHRVRTTQAESGRLDRLAARDDSRPNDNAVMDEALDNPRVIQHRNDSQRPGLAEHATERFEPEHEEAEDSRASRPNSFNARDGRPDSEGAKPSANPMQFEELNQLSDEALALIFRAAPSQVSLIALAGAKRPFVERLLQQLPGKDARSLNQKIERVGPIRLRDVEFAQRKLTLIAEELAQQGQFQIPTAHRFAAAA